MLHTDKPVLMIYLKSDSTYLVRQAIDEDFWNKNWTGGEWGTPIDYLSDLKLRFPIEQYNLLCFFTDMQDGPVIELRVMSDKKSFSGKDAYGMKLAGNSFMDLMMIIDAQLKTIKWSKNT